MKRIQEVYVETESTTNKDVVITLDYNFWTSGTTNPWVEVASSTWRSVVNSASFVKAVPAAENISPTLATLDMMVTAVS